MVITLNWVPPTNSSVGSVLIYRSANTIAESLGSHTIIATIDAKSGTNWVTSYSDASGTANNLYRVQFWDGVGSSNLSDVIGEEYSELLCDFDDVRRVAHLQNTDVGSEQLYYAIKDATDEVFYDAGDPIKTSVFYIQNDTGIDAQVYNFTGDLKPVYQVREVYVDAEDTEIVNNVDYELDFTNGNIKFTNAFLGSYNGKNVYVNWVPMTYHILIKYLAARDIVEGNLIYSGADIESPFVGKLNRKIQEIRDVIRPKGIYSIKSDDIQTQYDYVGQKEDRTSLYFNK